MALAHRTQCHIDGLLYEVARIVSCTLDEDQALLESVVAGRLVMNSEAPQQCEGRALLELFVTFAPLCNFGPSVRRSVEQVETHCVANCPVVEILAPTVHLRRADLRRIRDE